MNTTHGDDDSHMRAAWAWSLTIAWWVIYPVGIILWYLAWTLVFLLKLLYWPVAFLLQPVFYLGRFVVACLALPYTLAVRFEVRELSDALLMRLIIWCRQSTSILAWQHSSVCLEASQFVASTASSASSFISTQGRSCQKAELSSNIERRNDSRS